MVGCRDLRLRLNDFKWGQRSNINLLFVVAIELVRKFDLMQRDIDVASGERKFPIGVADRGD